MDTSDAVTLGVAILALGVAVGAAVLAYSVQQCTAPDAARAEPEDVAPAAAPLRALRGPDLPPFGPPMIDDLTLRDWLIWTWKTRIPESNIYGQGVWGNVVDDFYANAASRMAVWPHFKGRELGEIKRKFLATLLIVTHTGVSRQAADALAERHAHLGITGEAYDETCNALADTLTEYQVPERAVAQLVPALRYLRGRLVTA